MPTSLRAFLMTRTSAGEWDIEVSHSLEDVLRAWEQRCEESTTAVLHVGFERRVARSFEQLALQFPGKVLLTPSAKGAFPSSFATSKGAVGIVEGEPIFLALEGWGYAEPEPSQSNVALAANLSGWVKSFVLEHPEQEKGLTDIGIADDDTYLELEGTLKPELRTSLGIYRSAHLVGDERDDPTALARAAPPWLGSLELNHLDLTVRIGNVFRNRSLSRVSDIGALTIPDLLGFPNFGRTSIHQLSDILRRALVDGPRDEEEEVTRSTVGNLLEAVHLSLATCSDRERDILVRRMGLGYPTETLAEIGESHGVTRERIRQIEAKVVDRLVRREVWDDLLAAKLHVLLADREFPLPLIGAEALDPWFSGVAAHRDAVRYLIANMCNAAVSLVEIDGVEYLSFLNQDSWHEIVATARRLLASGVDQRWTEMDCQHHVILLIPDDAREFGALLWEISSKWCHFTDDAEARTLVSYGRGVDQVVEAPLDRQWHASELVDRLIGRGVALPDHFDKYQLDIALKQVGQLHSLGRMVWTRCEATNEKARVDIRQAVIAILQNAGEPLTSAELRQRLVAVRGINQGMQFQVIDPLIKLSSQLWALNDRDLSIKRPEQPALLASIVTRLRSRTKPVHISECAEIVGDAVPARALFCLAALDSRLRVTQDRFLTLTEWPSTAHGANGKPTQRRSQFPESRSGQRESALRPRRIFCEQ